MGSFTGTHLTPLAIKAASMALKLSVMPNAPADPISVPSRNIWLVFACLGLLQHPCDWPYNALPLIQRWNVSGLDKQCAATASGEQSPFENSSEKYSMI